MDSLTHIVSGAVIGEAFLGKKLGKKGMLIGAVAQSLPDIDVLASFWINPVDDLLFHRGITHSFLFGAIVSVALAFIMQVRLRSQGITTSRWIAFFAVEIGMHYFLDSLTSYGTGWFEPFSHARISFNTIFVADPFFTIALLVSSVALLIMKAKSWFRTRWVVVGLGISTLYLIYSFGHKYSVDRIVRENLKRQKISSAHYFTTPSMFNNWLWYVVAEDTAGFRTGYYSVFDRSDSIDFHYFPKQSRLLGSLKDSTEVQKLKRFSQGFYTVERKDGQLILNDLRFGQIGGWSNPEAPFVFHFFLEDPTGNDLVVQRGRFAGWSADFFSVLAARIGGKKPSVLPAKIKSKQE